MHEIHRILSITCDFFLSPSIPLSLLPLAVALSGHKLYKMNYELCSGVRRAAERDSHRTKPNPFLEIFHFVSRTRVCIYLSPVTLSVINRDSNCIIGWTEAGNTVNVARISVWTASSCLHASSEACSTKKWNGKRQRHKVFVYCNKYSSIHCDTL